MASLMGSNFTYDAENRITSAAQPGIGTVTYTYDGDGQRVMKAVSTGLQTVYVYDVGGKLVAEYSSGAASAPPCHTCFLSTDHLGSTRLVTDENGTTVSRHDYIPFGEEIAANNGGRDGTFGTFDFVNQKFTGKERDQETGLDYFGARYYGSALGRFTSPDPLNAAAGREEDPQSWNLYAYGRNNPLLYTDPNGEKYRICDANGKNCSEVSDNDFEQDAKNVRGAGEHVQNGMLYHYDSNSIRVNDGTYRQTDVDLSPWASALITSLGQNADAQKRFIGKFAAYSFLAGTGVAGGLQATGSGLTTLNSASPFFRYTTGQLNQIIGTGQRELLKEFFGQGQQGALSKLETFEVPSGLTQRTLEVYKDAAERVVQRGPGAPGFEVQRLRLQLVERALSTFK
jgi:RHS repeat-associated protein